MFMDRSLRHPTQIDLCPIPVGWVDLTLTSVLSRRVQSLLTILLIVPILVRVHECRPSSPRYSTCDWGVVLTTSIWVYSYSLKTPDLSNKFLLSFLVTVRSFRVSSGRAQRTVLSTIFLPRGLMWKDVSLFFFFGQPFRSLCYGIFLKTSGLEP